MSAYVYIWKNKLCQATGLLQLEAKAKYSVCLHALLCLRHVGLSMLECNSCQSSPGLDDVKTVKWVKSDEPTSRSNECFSLWFIQEKPAQGKTHKTLRFLFLSYSSHHRIRSNTPIVIMNYWESYQTLVVWGFHSIPWRLLCPYQYCTDLPELLTKLCNGSH